MAFYAPLIISLHFGYLYSSHFLGCINFNVLFMLEMVKAWAVISLNSDKMISGS